MGEAMWWAFVGASSLLIGAVLAFRVPIGRQLLGLIMGFGVGVLISAVSYELIEEAVAASANSYAVATGFVAGALVFFAGDVLIDRRVAASTGSGGGLGIVLGAVLDGIPESVVIGASTLTGESASVAVIVAVFLSNVPESIAASTDLVRDGMSKGKVLLIWVVVVATSTIAAGLGYALLKDATGSWVVRDPGVRGRRDPHDAGGRDDAGGVREDGPPQVGRPGRRVRLRAVGGALVQLLTGAGVASPSMRIADSSAPNRNSHVAHRMTIRSPTTEPIAP